MGDWKHWLKGLIAAIISGAATAVLSVVGTQITGDPLHNNQIGAIAAGGAIIGAAMYLKQSPLPADDLVTQVSKAHIVTDTVTIGQRKVAAPAEAEPDPKPAPID